MKILHVNTHVDVGGIGQYIVTLTEALKDHGIDCVVASSGGDLESELQRYGITHRYLNIDTKSELSPKVLKTIFGLSKIIKEEKVDLIHAHTRVSQVVSFFTSLKTGIPYVSTCHGYFKARIFRRYFDTWGKKVIAISDAVKTHLEKNFGINEKRIELIYNGVDIDKFSVSYKREDIIKAKRTLRLKEGPVVGTMGRLSPVKGQRFLIEAMKYVISRRKDAQCLIIGGGAEENKLKKLAKDIGLEESINFAGSNYSDIPLYLSCMDVFVLPSVEEGLGLALLEAMSAGKSCIGSNVGGIGEVIQDGITGLLVPVGDVKAIGDAILKILDDKTLNEKMGSRGREFIKEKFSLSLMAEKMAGLYKEVISEK